MNDTRLEKALVNLQKAIEQVQNVMKDEPSTAAHLSIQDQTPKCLKGISVLDSYSDGPNIEATEFSLAPTFSTIKRQEIAKTLRPKVKSLSAHLNSYLPVQEVHREVEFDNQAHLIDFFVAHVTKRSKTNDWLSARKDYASCGRKIHFENHIIRSFRH